MGVQSGDQPAERLELKKFLLGQKVNHARNPHTDQRRIGIGAMIGSNDHRTFERNMFGADDLEPPSQTKKYSADKLPKRINRGRMIDVPNVSHETEIFLRMSQKVGNEIATLSAF